MAQSSGDLQTPINHHHHLPDWDQQSVMYIDFPKEMDVVYGRGGLSNNHDGNKVFRELIMERKEEYEKTSDRSGKNKIADEIVKQMRNKGSRFLQYSEGAQMWFDSGDSKAVEKTKQRFRELRDKRIQSRKVNQATRKEKLEKEKEVKKEDVLDSKEAEPKPVMGSEEDSHTTLSSTQEGTQHKDLIPKTYQRQESSSRLESTMEEPLSLPIEHIPDRTFNEEIPLKTDIEKQQDAFFQMQNFVAGRVKENNRLSRESEATESMQDRLARLYSLTAGKRVSSTDNNDTLDRRLGQITGADNASKYTELQSDYIGSVLDPYPTLRGHTLCSRDISQPRLEGLPPRNNSHAKVAPSNATPSSVLSRDELWHARESRHGHTAPPHDELLLHHRLEALRQSHDTLSRMRETWDPEQPCPAAAPMSMEAGIEGNILCNAMADVALCNTTTTRRKQTSCASSIDMSLFSDLSGQCPDIDKVEHRLSHIPIQDFELETDESRRVSSASLFPKQQSSSSLPQAAVVVETVNVVFADNELGRERTGGMSVSDNDSTRSVLTMSDIGNSDHLCDEAGSHLESGRRVPYERSDSARSILSEFDNMSYIEEATIMSRE